MWWHNFLGQLIRPEVIDAVRSWFATLSGVAATAFSFIIVLIACHLLGVQAHLILLVALVLTHIEAILCLFYLQRISLESLKGKIGVVELEMETNSDNHTQQLVKTTAYGVDSSVNTTSEGTDSRTSASGKG